MMRIAVVGLVMMVITGVAHGETVESRTWYFLRNGICFAPGDPRLNMDEFGIYNTRLVKTPADVAILLRKAGADERTDPDSTDNDNVVTFYVSSRGKGAARILMVNGLPLCQRMAHLGIEQESQWFSVRSGICEPMPDTPDDFLRESRAAGASVQPAPNNTKGTIEGYHVSDRGREFNVVFIKGLKGCRLMVQAAKANHQNVP